MGGGRLSGVAARSWAVVLAVPVGVLGLSAGLEAWPDPFDAVSLDFFRTAAPLAVVFGLALFVELALVLEPYDPEKPLEKAFEGLVRTVVRGNSLLLLVSGGAALYAVGSGKTSTFLLGCVVLPWLVQVLVLVDTAYYRIGLHRLRRPK